MNNKMHVFYTPKMVADSQSMSPSAAKPAPVVQSWSSKFDIQVVEPEPVAEEDLKRAHDSQFVENILSGRIPNGFGNRSTAVASTLRYTSGSMLSAAKHALKHRVAAAPCSGFHHAGPERAEGFCTFNGLMVTALTLREENLVKKVGILDLDNHYGNGTEDILNKMADRSWVTHFTGGAHYSFSYQVRQFFEELPDILQSFSDCDIVLYQAGADPHIRDGGWMTTAELHARDRKVFEFFHKRNIPIAWNLAGGYQVESDGSIPKILEIHDNTMEACMEFFYAEEKE